jgi:hypothetical protein
MDLDDSYFEASRMQMGEVKIYLNGLYKSVFGLIGISNMIYFTFFSSSLTFSEGLNFGL